jgi:hypothetical protein
MHSLFHQSTRRRRALQRVGAAIIVATIVTVTGCDDPAAPVLPRVAVPRSANLEAAASSLPPAPALAVRAHIAEPSGRHAFRQ